MRIIAHVDMDAFFAAIEQRDNPRLKGKPVIIGGSRHRPRGVVSTCSYEARKYGVHSAMPLAQAVRLCPHGIFLPGNMAKYRQVSAELQQIFASFTDLYEPISIDEAYLDLTDRYREYSSLWQLGLALKKAIRDQLDLTASVGIAATKSAAKMGSTLHKPDGLTIILPEDFDRIIGPLPVRSLHGVGAKTAERLENLGIRTVLDIRRFGRKAMISHFGKLGDWIYNLSCGIDPRPVEPRQTRKSVGRETTFDSDLNDEAEIKKTLKELAADVSRRLQAHHLWGETITLKLRDPDFTTTTHSLSVNYGINSADEISQAALVLLDRAWASIEPNRRKPLRLVGISVSNLSENRQLNLFTPPRESKVDRLLVDLNQQFGKGVITTGHLSPHDKRS